MKSIFIFFIFLSGANLFALTQVNLKDKKEIQKVTKTCHLHLSFASYGSGTPTKVIKDIDQYIKENESSFIKKTSWSWGFEGEFDYCLILQNKGEEQKHFKAMKEIIPAFSKEGYTVLKTSSGLKYQTSWPLGT